MQKRIMIGAATVLAAWLAAAAGAVAQEAADPDAMRLLAPFSALNAGQAVLARNFAVTRAIQTGAAHQPTLLPFAAQQRQAISDATITSENDFDLADGLGTTLGAAYRSVAHYGSTDGGKTKDITYPPDSVKALIARLNAASGKDANTAKYLFANGTSDGTQPAAPDLLQIIAQAGGSGDTYGKAYKRPAGSPGADPRGNSRPFQTEPRLTVFTAPDFWGNRTHSTAYLHGPVQDLTASPAFPSGHTTYGYTGSLLLALLIPPRYPQMIARGAEYGNDRIIMGAHYTTDVIGGRTLATYKIAHLLADKSVRDALVKARIELAQTLGPICGGQMMVCARRDHGRFADARKVRAFYESTQTYGLPPVRPARLHAKDDIAKVAPEAGYLLTSAFTYLTLDQADAILADTEGPGGGYLDGDATADGHVLGVYSRLDLYRAAEKAIALAPKPGKPGNKPK